MSEETNIISQVSEDDIKTAKEKFPGAKLLTIRVITDDERKFKGLFRKPTVDSFRRYIALASGQSSDTVRASAVFVNDAAIVPTREEYIGIAKELPGLIINLANQLSEGYGLPKDTKKKFL